MQPCRRVQPAVRNHPHEMSSLVQYSNDPKVNILVAIANDDAENVARLATNELKAAKIGGGRFNHQCPEPILGHRAVGILCGLDDDGGGTYHGLKLWEGQTLRDIAVCNNKQAAAAALLPNPEETLAVARARDIKIARALFCHDDTAPREFITAVDAYDAREARLEADRDALARLRATHQDHMDEAIQNAGGRSRRPRRGASSSSTGVSVEDRIYEGNAKLRAERGQIDREAARLDDEAAQLAAKE